MPYSVISVFTAWFCVMSELIAWFWVNYCTHCLIMCCDEYAHFVILCKLKWVYLLPNSVLIVMSVNNAWLCVHYDECTHCLILRASSPPPLTSPCPWHWRRTEHCLGCPHGLSYREQWTNICTDKTNACTDIPCQMEKTYLSRVNSNI